MIFLDYLATGISVRGHPMEHLRARLDAAGIVSAGTLDETANGSRAVVAGLIVARQRPATAKGTIFLLLEDEFGFMNVIVPEPVYAENREMIRHAMFLMAEGRVERDGPVTNVVGNRFRALRSPGLAHKSRDFH